MESHLVTLLRVKHCDLSVYVIEWGLGGLRVSPTAVTSTLVGGIVCTVMNGLGEKGPRGKETGLDGGVWWFWWFSQGVRA